METKERTRTVELSDVDCETIVRIMESINYPGKSIEYIVALKEKFKPKSEDKEKSREAGYKEAGFSFPDNVTLC